MHTTKKQLQGDHIDVHQTSTIDLQTGGNESQPIDKEHRLPLHFNDVLPYHGLEHVYQSRGHLMRQAANLHKPSLS